MKNKEGFIDVVGCRVWFKIVGIENKTPPLLVIHGGPGISHDYLEPLEELAIDRSVIFYDQLGNGKSDKPDNPDLWVLERFVEELSQVRSYLRLDKVHILGHSWGTMLAVAYMQDRKPKGVESLILSAPCLSVSRWEKDQRSYLKEFSQEFQKIIYEAESCNYFEEKYQNAMMEYYKLHVCRMKIWPDCLNRSFSQLAMNIYGKMWGPSEFTVTGNLKNFERAERLEEIGIPTLFTCGEFDEATPETTSYYKSCAKNSVLKIFKGASHVHHLENKEEYINTVRSFVLN
ncbi:MAG: proline iminopeptidase [Deltaproteobacteria bacterium CG07_land_8_20_14_0_80_38_7]|nr:MAG: proline iminopeptidase [Deltaproteobacteria bacterium CG07_land_8_20_14_0_80_38_7]